MVLKERPKGFVEVISLDISLASQSTRSDISDLLVPPFWSIVTGPLGTSYWWALWATELQ